MPEAQADREPLDPTDPAAHEKTLAYLRGLISSHEQNSAEAQAPTGSTPHGTTPVDTRSVGTTTPAPAGQESTVSEQAALRSQPQSHEEWVDRGREISLRQLSFSARSSEQLRQAMLSREVPGAAAEEVIARLTNVGLIDDAEYADMLVRTRQAERGLSRRALLVELARKGIAPDLAEKAVAQIDAADEAAAARELVRKRLRTMRSVDPTTRRKRLYGTLGRKGYGASAARAAIDSVLTEEGLALY